MLIPSLYRVNSLYGYIFIIEIYKYFPRLDHKVSFSIVGCQGWGPFSYPIVRRRDKFVSFADEFNATATQKFEFFSFRL